MLSVNSNNKAVKPEGEEENREVNMVGTTTATTTTTETTTEARLVLSAKGLMTGDEDKEVELRHVGSFGCYIPCKSVTSHVCNELLCMFRTVC